MSRTILKTLESLFANIPGMYIVYPVTPADAKGLLASSIRDNNPVMYLESVLSGESRAIGR